MHAESRARESCACACACECACACACVGAARGRMDTGAYVRVDKCACERPSR